MHCAACEKSLRSHSTVSSPACVPGLHSERQRQQAPKPPLPIFAADRNKSYAQELRAERRGQKITRRSCAPSGADKKLRAELRAASKITQKLRAAPKNYAKITRNPKKLRKNYARQKHIVKSYARAHVPLRAAGRITRVRMFHCALQAELRACVCSTASENLSTACARSSVRVPPPRVPLAFRSMCSITTACVPRACPMRSIEWNQ